MGKQDRYSEYRKAEKSLGLLRSLGTELLSRVVDDSSAQSVLDEYTEKIAGIVETEKSFGEVMFVAHGNDVLEPIIQPTIEDATVSFKVDPQEPRRNLSNITPAMGVFASVTISRAAAGSGDQFYLGANMYLKGRTKTTDIPLGDEPFTRIERMDYVKVPLSKRADVDIQVQQLELLRAQKEAFLGLSKSGLSQSVYAKKIRSLGEALTSEKPHYVKLNDISLLHHIGRLGKVHADALGWKDDRITEPLVKTLGQDRQVTLTSDCIISYGQDGNAHGLHGKYSGKIIDVCANIRDVDSGTLFLVLQSLADPGAQAYIPLDEVKEFWF